MSILCILHANVLQHENKIREGKKDSTLLSSTIFFHFIMQKRTQYKYISAKKERNYVSLIGAYGLNEIEP